MAPAASKSKAYSNPLATQADDAKYKSKYKELKAKVQEIEEDNTKLSMRILRSKKAIQRLRIERAILYDRLQSNTAPSNPFALSSAAHLATVASSAPPSAPGAPPSILTAPSYPLADPSAPSLFLKQLDAQKLAALQRGGDGGFGERPHSGVAGEGQKAREEAALMAAGGPINGEEQKVNGAAAPVVQHEVPVASAVPQAAEAPYQPMAEQQMQVDHA
ncbi:hypothetical protein JCM1840_005962 [Sporobolomyces johnsonii]